MTHLRLLLSFLAVAILALVLSGPAHAQIMVDNYSANKIVEYYVKPGSSGTVYNSNYVTGSPGPYDLSLYNNNLYVLSYSNASVNEYNATTGALIKSNLITGLGSFPVGIATTATTVYVGSPGSNTVAAYDSTTGKLISSVALTNPQGMAISGNYLYVSSYSNSDVYALNLTTNTLSAPLATGIGEAEGITIDGNLLFVTSYASDDVLEYTISLNAMTGAPSLTYNKVFATGYRGPNNLTSYGNTLYVADYSTGVMSEYDIPTDTKTVASLITGLSGPSGFIYVPQVVLPEPRSWTLGAIMVLAICGLLVHRARQGSVEVEA